MHVCIDTKSKHENEKNNNLQSAIGYRIPKDESKTWDRGINTIKPAEAEPIIPQSIINTPYILSKRNDVTTQPVRKAPQAPKRFRSAFILFSREKRNGLKTQLGPTALISDIAKHTSRLWHTLPPDEKSHWEEMARRDKLRYEQEKSSYSGPWYISTHAHQKKKSSGGDSGGGTNTHCRHSSPRDPSYPKRPMSAFLHFAKTERSKLKKENPDISFTEASVILGQRWRNAAEDVKKHHREWEEKEREVYNDTVRKWREREVKNREERERVALEEAMRKDRGEGWTNVMVQKKTKETSSTTTSSAVGVTKTIKKRNSDGVLNQVKGSSVPDMIWSSSWSVFGCGSGSGKSGDILEKAGNKIPPMKTFKKSKLSNPNKTESFSLPSLPPINDWRHSHSHSNYNPAIDNGNGNIDGAKHKQQQQTSPSHFSDGIDELRCEEDIPGLIPEETVHRHGDGATTGHPISPYDSKPSSSQDQKYHYRYSIRPSHPSYGETGYNPPKPERILSQCSPIIATMVTSQPSKTSSTATMTPITVNNNGNVDKNDYDDDAERFWSYPPLTPIETSRVIAMQQATTQSGITDANGKDADDEGRGNHHGSVKSDMTSTGIWDGAEHSSSLTSLFHHCHHNDDPQCAAVTRSINMEDELKHLEPLQFDRAMVGDDSSDHCLSVSNDNELYGLVSHLFDTPMME